MTILSSEEIEMIFNSMHTEVPPVWTPVPTANSERVLYYNKHFDIYCSQLPLVSSAFLETGTSLTLNDNQVDLSPRDLQSASKHKDRTFKLMSYSNRSTNTPSKRSSLSSASCNYHSPSTHAERRNSSTSTTPSNCYRVVSETSSVQQPHSRGLPQKHHSAPAVGVSSATASKRKQPPPSLQSCQHKHTKTQAILAKPDLFYHHTMDIKLWPELRDSTLYYAKRAHEMLIKNNQMEFEAVFQLSSTYCTYTQIACRLSYSHIKESCHVKEVKRLLKRIITSLAKIGINSSIYFASSRRSSHTWNTTPRASEVSATSVENDDDIDTGAITRSGTAGAATLTSEDIPKSQNLEYTGPVAQNERSSSFGYASVRNDSATTTGTSVPGDKNNIDGFATDSMIASLYENLDNEFTQFIRTIQLLYHVLQTSVTAGDYIPQLFPRFFRGSFNGGSWTNPFSQFDPVNSGLNDTEDSSNNGSSVGGLPPKIAEAIAAASGCYAASYIDFNSQITSPDEDFHPNHKAILCQGFNRPSHHRTFSRSRASRRIQYPLSENTVNMMKKRYFSICEKISSFELNEESQQDPELSKSKKRQLEVTSQTYEEVSSCILLEVLENLDLGIFVNLRTLIASNKHLDAESEEFLRHALSSISTLLTEFFDTKQAFHDTVIKLIMCAQQLTLCDPYVFCSMRPNTPVGYYEPGMSPSQSHFNKIDKAVVELYKLLVAQDVEVNNMQYLRAFDEFSDVCLKYTEIASLSCTITEQLVEERENLLNYAARTMRNDLTTKLLKGESEKWFGDYEVFEPEDNEEQSVTYHSSDDEYRSDDNRKESLDKDTPWFLGSEFEKTLIYDPRGRVKGGTKKALIEHLTSHEVIDAWFNVTMLLTFRSMFTTREFLYALVHRYNLYPPEGLSYDEYNLWVEKKLNPIKCRVVSILKSFFSQYWTPAYFEPGISATLNFAHIAVSENIPGAQELLQVIKDNLASHGKAVPNQPDIGTFVDPVASDDSSDSHRPALSARSSSSSFLKLRRYKLLDIDPKTYAAQLTIMEHALYLRITVFECLDRAWGSKYCDMGGSVNIANFIASANNLTNYVSHAIVQQSEVKIRALLIQYFVSVAEHCRELNNFSSMTAIVSALCSSPIYRLKKTWPLVSKGCTNVLKELNKLMDSAKNFIHYRELLRSVKDVACVPFFGVYLSDLTFTFGGNPDYLPNSSDIVNFGKRGRIVDIVEEIMSFKKIHYKLKRYDDIQTIIEGSLENVPHIEKQYELSLIIEPRSDAQNRATANDPLKGFRSSAAPDDRNSRLLKFGKKQSSRMFAKPNE